MKSRMDFSRSIVSTLIMVLVVMFPLSGCDVGSPTESTAINASETGNLGFGGEDSTKDGTATDEENSEDTASDKGPDGTWDCYVSNGHSTSFTVENYTGSYADIDGVHARFDIEDTRVDMTAGQCGYFCSTYEQFYLYPSDWVWTIDEPNIEPIGLYDGVVTEDYIFGSCEIGSGATVADNHTFEAYRR